MRKGAQQNTRIEPGISGQLLVIDLVAPAVTVQDRTQLANVHRCSGGRRLFFFINHLGLGLSETDPLGLRQGIYKP